MPNKTIYVSDSDTVLFEEAKEIAGEALSSVISRALREYVSRNTKKNEGMKEVSVKVGKGSAVQEKRFVGSERGNWQGFSDDHEWWMEGKIYFTQKRNWAVYTKVICKASLLLDKKSWKQSGDYLLNPRRDELFIGIKLNDFKGKIPSGLCETLSSLINKEEVPIEYLDI